jgi:hypothetical protein
MLARLIGSHTLVVNVVCHSGTESGGNAVIPVTVLHPEEHVTVAAELCPAVNISVDDRYQNTVPLTLVPVNVAVTGTVIVNTVAPMRIWHGVPALHPEPSVCTVDEALFATKSPSCDALPAPPPDPPPVPPRRLHMFVAVHPNRFWPAGALESKKIWPVEHTPGIAGPTCAGFVEPAREKSTFFDWDAKSTCVWAPANGIAAIKNTVAVPIRRESFIVFTVFHLQKKLHM